MTTDAHGELDTVTPLESSTIHLAPVRASFFNNNADALLRDLSRPQMIAQGLSVIDEQGECIGIVLNLAGFETLRVLRA